MSFSMLCWSLSFFLLFLFSLPETIETTEIENRGKAVGMSNFECLIKVEKILKSSLDSIPSPSPLVKIQIMGLKVSLRCKFPQVWYIIQQSFALLPQVNFPVNSSDFH